MVLGAPRGACIYYIGRLPISGRILIVGSILAISDTFASKTGTSFAVLPLSSPVISLMRARDVSAEVILGSLTKGIKVILKV